MSLMISYSKFPVVYDKIATVQTSCLPTVIWSPPNSSSQELTFSTLTSIIGHLGRQLHHRQDSDFRRNSGHSRGGDSKDLDHNP